MILQHWGALESSSRNGLLGFTMCRSATVGRQTTEDFVRLHGERERFAGRVWAALGVNPERLVLRSALSGLGDCRSRFACLGVLLLLPYARFPEVCPVFLRGRS
jgi:hypothetical protein